MDIYDVIGKYCTYVPGEGMVLKEDAPLEAIEVYRDWNENRPNRPDKNGVIRVID